MNLEYKYTPLYLAAAYVVVELLSSILNPVFMDVIIAGRVCKLNPSVVFFCIGFFIVDIIFDFYNAKMASHFFNIKIFSIILFVSLGKFFLHYFDTNNDTLKAVFNESSFVFVYGVFAYYVSYKLMGRTMKSVKRSSISNSIFCRYFITTVPSEIIFSFIFTFLSFRNGNTLIELLGIFLTSSLIKIVLSFIFAGVITVLFYCKILREEIFNNSNSIDATAN